MQTDEIYGGTARRLSDLLDDLDDAAWSTPVTATPSWTVRDLVAHLAGLTADVQAGRLEGAGTDEWTARQIAERDGRSAAEVLAEWRAGFPKIEAMLARGEGSPAFAYDVLVHEHDIRGALGHAGISDLATVTAVVEPLVQYLGARITKAEKPALKLLVDGSEWVAGSGDPKVTAETGLYELFRALFGRRSENQVRSWQWSDDPSTYFEVLSVFGPVRQDDVIE
jgi:uncharacterized protein (TIGR03083 family)